MSLATSCFQRRIKLVDGRTAYLQVPTVRQVVEITHVLQHLEDGQGEELLFELLAGLQWKGCFDVVFQLKRMYKNKPFKFAEFIRDILLQGYDPKEETQKTKDSEEGKKHEEQDTDWNLLISQYCRVSGKDPFDVWNQTPFPFFMERIIEARKEEARRHINAALENQFAMGGSEETMKMWRKQAGWEKKEKKKKADTYGETLSREQIEKNRESLKNRLNR